jgi:methionine biosynthesis protein MetW
VSVSLASRSARKPAGEPADVRPAPAAALRADLQFIADWIAPGSRVLDLGCGDGALLGYLRDQRQCRGYGVEISDDLVAASVARGVNVVQGDLGSGLKMFTDGMFDTVVLSQTLQAMENAEVVLHEMRRLGREGIVSFPNFGHWRHILALLAGRMPVSRQIPYQWYDTPNIHLCTPKDFEILAAQVGCRIIDRALLDEGHAVRWAPNLRSTLAVYRFAGS